MAKRYYNRNGAHVTMERLFPSGYFLVELWDTLGNLHDKMLCDDKRDALTVYNSFKIAARKMD
jgi:hypothetical protein